MTASAAINESRDTADRILRTLEQRAHLLGKLVAKPAPVALTKFDVLNELELRNFSVPFLEYGKFVELFRQPAGVWTRIDHWNWNSFTPPELVEVEVEPEVFEEEEIEPPGQSVALAIGDGRRVVAIVDTSDGQSNRPIRSGGKSNPQKLVIPPATPVVDRKSVV